MYPKIVNSHLSKNLEVKSDEEERNSSKNG